MLNQNGILLNYYLVCFCITNYSLDRNKYRMSQKRLANEHALHTGRSCLQSFYPLRRLLLLVAT